MAQVPKLIHPLPPNEVRVPKGSGSDAEDIEEEPPTPHPLTDTWMQVFSLQHACNIHDLDCVRGIHLWQTMHAAVVKLAYKTRVVLTLLGRVVQAINDERPPTPPRGRPQNAGNSLAFFE